MSRPGSESHAVRQLERRLVRRRFAQLDLRLRLELALLALLIGGFLFWQVRVPLDGLARRAGPGAVLQVLAIAGLILAAIGGVLVALRHVRRLRTGAEGPPWLSMPISAAGLARHLAWESRSHALWVAVPALGVLAAAVSLVPAWWLLVSVVAFVLVLGGAARLGAAIGLAWATRRTPLDPARRVVPGVVRILGDVPPEVRRGRLPRARWNRTAPWRALWWKDLRITRRLPAVARSALLVLALWLCAFLTWFSPGELALRHFIALGFSLLAAAALAEWLVAMSGSDPFATLRVLPVGLGTVWGARFAWAVLGTVVLCAGHVLAARELSPHALRLFLGWSAAATLGISALGVNYGVTLFPRADVAQRLLGLSLALAVAASIMIPLSGWLVLLSAILHSARRLPHWGRLEEA
jgi:hypothetical protein